MIKGFYNLNQIKNAIDLFEQMKNDNISLDVVKFTTFINYYCKN